MSLPVRSIQPVPPHVDVNLPASQRDGSPFVGIQIQAWYSNRELKGLLQRVEMGRQEAHDSHDQL